MAVLDAHRLARGESPRGLGAGGEHQHLAGRDRRGDVVAAHVGGDHAAHMRREPPDAHLQHGQVVGEARHHRDARQGVDGGQRAARRLGRDEAQRDHRRVMVERGDARLQGLEGQDHVGAPDGGGVGGIDRPRLGAEHDGDDRGELAELRRDAGGVAAGRGREEPDHDQPRRRPGAPPLLGARLDQRHEVVRRKAERTGMVEKGVEVGPEMRRPVGPDPRQRAVGHVGPRAGTALDQSALAQLGIDLAHRHGRHAGTRREFAHRRQGRADRERAVGDAVHDLRADEPPWRGRRVPRGLRRGRRDRRAVLRGRIRLAAHLRVRGTACHTVTHL